MTFLEEMKLMEEWRCLFSFDDASTECLEYIAGELSNEEDGKRDTENDDLITNKFYFERKNQSNGFTEKIYSSDLSEKFVKDLEQAIKESEEKGDRIRTEKLKTILNIATETKTKIERDAASKVIHNFRYRNLNREKILVEDETLVSNINRFFYELEQEASAGYALNSTIYVYLTNAKDKNDFLKRLEVVSSKLEEYEKSKSSESLEYIKEGIETSVKDFESGDILGKDTDVDGR